MYADLDWRKGQRVDAVRGPRSEKFRETMRKATAGSRNPRWVKDRTKLKIRRVGVEKFLIEQWRKQVFERDDYTCQKCGKRGGRLNADHIKPVRLFPELVLELSNGRTLCAVPCHKETPTYSGKVLKLKREDFEEGGFLFQSCQK
jgi:5-methylcytosine-specific restriction endonuclease McrA